MTVRSRCLLVKLSILIRKMALSMLQRSITKKYGLFSLLSPSVLQKHYISHLSYNLNNFLQSNVLRNVCSSYTNYSMWRNLCRTMSTSEDVDENDEEKPGLKRKVNVFDAETSIRYMNSKAYETTYGIDPVWKPYRRNHKYGIPPRKTRKMCIRLGRIATGSPCPICRDDYLVLHETNLKLLKQFICPHTGNILNPIKTGICRKQHQNLEVAILKAKDFGYLEFEVPQRMYNYHEYYEKHNENFN